ncbi:hypothetical protein MKW98_029286 [Papaver atlanticum]|uniref:Glutathione hydrolase n=1 Tax=Papaver atlanticum TaxID=357466 RepID=A0AAD4SK57_9MAGN|nr:hypothetical protein MKW98_029286 [Papaver atlanticum]
MGQQEESFTSPLLGCYVGLPNNNHDQQQQSRETKRSNWYRIVCVSIAILTTIILVGVGANSIIWGLGDDSFNDIKYEKTKEANQGSAVESEHGVVAADDGRCSEIGASTLRDGGHAVDAAVATALCLGVVHPMSSGIGGGGFIVVRDSSTSKNQAYDCRETAPLAASKDMYAKNPTTKSHGALSMGVPGEIAGLHEVWLRHGRLPWSKLIQPAIKLAKDGFLVTPCLAKYIKDAEKKIMNDRGLIKVYAPNGNLLQDGDTCYNIELGNSLEMIAKQGPQAFYNGTVGEKLVQDVKKAGGILTMEDLKSYKVDVMDAMAVDVMGFTILGMPLPSSGTLGLSLVLNILNSYGLMDFEKSPLGLHRLVEALKHMFAIRMNLGDPKFVNTTQYESEMLSPSFAAMLRDKILDNTTFPPDYYLNKWSQLQDHGTSHFCIVDAERNAVSMTTTVNYGFGGGVLSPSTGIVLNNEMDDFSTPTEEKEDGLPPAPANYIQPNKRPLSSMTPIIILKGNQLAGVIGGSGGMYIIPAVLQVFLNRFVIGMEPLPAIQRPRVYVKLIPNVVFYENWTTICGEHIELSEENKSFLRDRGHALMSKAGGAITQLVVQTFQTSTRRELDGNDQHQGVRNGILTAVSDPRKDGKPAAV